jgi:hypothetical protein
MTNDVRKAYWHVANSAESNFKNNREGAEKLDALIVQAGVLKKSLLDGINRNNKELRENLEKRLVEQHKQKGARKRRA